MQLLKLIRVALVACYCVRSQSPTPPAFDAAEIKPVKPGGNARVTGDFKHGRLVVHNATLHMLINTAYSVRFDLITGGPKWMDSDLFDVSAIADPATSEETSKLMLRTLLEERFRLATHHEKKTTAVFVLLKENSGRSLHKTPEDQPERPGCRSGMPLACYKMNMTDLAAMLPNISQDIDRPVIDLTGLEGRYDFTLSYAGATRRSIFDALEGLGLKLEARKHPIDYLVVDRAERPAE